MTGCVLVMLVTALTFLAPQVGHACGSPGLEPYELVPDERDITPPAAPVLTFSVRRGRPPERDGCGYRSSSCDDTGLLRLFPDEDEDSLEPDLGYVIELVEGDLKVQYEGEPVQAQYGELQLTWADGEGTDDLALTLDVWSVDRAGNLSTEATRIVVRSPGRTGCSASSVTGGAGWWLVASLSLLARARRPKLPA